MHNCNRPGWFFPLPNILVASLHGDFWLPPWSLNTQILCLLLTLSLGNIFVSQTANNCRGYSLRKPNRLHKAAKNKQYPINGDPSST